MALLEAVHSGGDHVTQVRTELARVREALDRTDAVLDFADETLDLAETAIVAGRRWGPIILGVVGVAAVGATVFVLLRKRRARQED